MANNPLKVLTLGAGVLVAGLGTAYFAGAFNSPSEMALESARVEVPEAPEQSGSEPSSQGEMAAAAAPEVQDAPEKQNQKFQGLIPGFSDADSGSAAPDAASEGDTETGQATTDDGFIVPTFDLLRAEPDGSMVIAGRAAPNAEVEILNGSSVLAKTESGVSGDFAAVLDKPLEPGDYNIVLRGTAPDSVATSAETAVVSIPSSEDGQVVALVQEPGEPSRLITAPQAQPPETPDSAEEPEGQEVVELPGPVKTPAGKDEADGRENADAAEDAAPAGAVDQGQAIAAAPDGDVASETEALNEAPSSAEEAGSSGGEDGRAADDAQNQVAARSEVEKPATAEARGSEASEGPEQETAAARREEEASSENAGASPFIEAVEIDGRQVFVAGRAPAEHRVRVYVNDILLGQTDATPDGSFLIEAERDLPVGDYIVRADVLDSDGSSVIARAAVPFERPAGEQFAAVAGDGSAGQASEETQGNSAGEGAAAPTGDAIPDELARSRPGESMEAGDDGDNSRASIGQNRMPNPAAGGGDGAYDTAMPALEPTDGAVIIRRGDTLWQISRRVYGQGVRYSTIYVANQDQIRDPDLIYPGQIFSVPDSTEEGEVANFDAIEDQLPPADDAPANTDS